MKLIADATTRVVDYVKMIRRNPSWITQFVRRGKSTRQAMDRYRNRPENRYCKYCGTKKKIEIHHIIPVSVDDTLADREDNFISLCNKCHFSVGHGGSYTSFVINIKEVCEIRKLAKTIKSGE